jgi:DinB superfamily
MNIPVSISDRLKTQHLGLPTIIAGLGDEHILRNPLPGKWSIKDNIAHLARYQLVFINRINLILTSDRPVFEAYRAENDIEFEKWTKKNLDQLSEELNADRKTLTDLVTPLTGNELRRVGVHSKFGNLTILEWTEFFLLHEAHHLFTIFRLAHDASFISK